MSDLFKRLYENPDILVNIAFSNKTKKKIFIWVEPTCVSIDLDANTEYKIVSHERYFSMDFNEDNNIVFWLEYSFGFQLYKRIGADWTLDYDCSEINL